MARLPGCFEVAHHHLQLEVGDFHRGFCLLHWTSRCSLLPQSLEKFDVMFWFIDVCCIYMFVWCLWNILMWHRSFAICLCRLMSQCSWIAPPVASGSPLASPFPKALPWLVWLVVSVVELCWVCCVSLCQLGSTEFFRKLVSIIQFMAKSIKIQSWEQIGSLSWKSMEISCGLAGHCLWRKSFWCWNALKNKRRRQYERGRSLLLQP